MVKEITIKVVKDKGEACVNCIFREISVCGTVRNILNLPNCADPYVHFKIVKKEDKRNEKENV